MPPKKGHILSEETKKKISESKKGKASWNKGLPSPWARKRMLENNPMKLAHNRDRMRNNNPMSHSGEVAYKRKDYKAIHSWISNKFGTPRICEKCKTEDHRPRMIHWANISGKYLRDRNDWKRLCYKCHKQLDMINIKHNGKNT